MKFKLQILFTLVVVLFLAYFVYEAKEWRLQARLYPWAVGIPALILGLIQLIFDLTGVGAKKTSIDTPVDFQFTQSIDTSLARRRALNIFSWIFGFLILIWLVGFSVAVPTMVFLYLKIQAGEKWPLSIALTLAAWLLFWGLFHRLLRLPFPEGQLQTWLGM